MQPKDPPKLSLLDFLARQARIVVDFQVYRRECTEYDQSSQKIVAKAEAYKLQSATAEPSKLREQATWIQARCLEYAVWAVCSAELLFESSADLALEAIRR